ncbi:MAG: hypothetical protein Q8N23_17745 [Archangium sp.]|nr:hypothetical protein [Archangium sp.]MDP3569435.1 hypothetical protein [Archangium sp.]
MTYRLTALCLLAAACAPTPTTPEGSLIENHGPTSQAVKGLLRTAQGPFLKGQLETLTALYDAAHVRSVSWSATGGALSSREAKVSWTLPETEQAELTLTLTLDDGQELVTPFSFSLVEAPEQENTHVSRSAREALLATPMPVLDGGVSEISGGACDLAYDSTAAVHLTFTSSTHPAVYYGKWNGTAWTLEVMDTLGFNTGGRITTSQAQLRVDSANNPHILYVRDNQVYYATRVGAGAWTRERVDSAGLLLMSDTNRALGFGLNASGRPSVVYMTMVGSYERVVFATRTAANTWSTTQLNFTTGTNTVSRVEGDILFDSAGTAFFPVTVYTSLANNYQDYLASWNGTATDVKLMTNTTIASGWDTTRTSAAWAGTGRALFRTAAGLYDFTIAAPLSNSTWTWSANESSGAGVGDLAWNGRPVMLHHHGGNLELVTPSSTGAAFWTWTQLGSSSGVSSAIAVHPTTGVPSICYQANGRVMFQ